jgi:hypothetical protein
MLFGICHTRKFGSVPGSNWFGKFGITTNLESVYSNNVGWQIRIWYRISTDIIVYAKQVSVTSGCWGFGITYVKLMNQKT